MFLQYVIKAPRAGRVKQVSHKSGDNVKKGTQLVFYEESWGEYSGFLDVLHVRCLFILWLLSCICFVLMAVKCRWQSFIMSMESIVSGFIIFREAEAILVVTLPFALEPRFFYPERDAILPKYRKSQYWSQCTVYWQKYVGCQHSRKLWRGVGFHRKFSHIFCAPFFRLYVLIADHWVIWA